MYVFGARPLGRVVTPASSLDATKASVFAQIQNAIRAGAYVPAVNKLIDHFNAMPDPVRERLRKPSEPLSFTIWYGIVRPTSPIPFFQVGTFIESAPGSIEPVAFALMDGAKSGIHYGLSLAGAPYPIIIYPKLSMYPSPSQG